MPKRVRERIGAELFGVAPHVARRRGAEEGENDVGTRGHAPGAERLPEVFGLRLKTDAACHVEEPPDPESRIDEESEDRADTVVHLPLQGVVERVARDEKVVERVRDARTDDFGGDLHVPFGRGLQNRTVDPVVEAPDVAVHGFPRVGGIFTRVGRNFGAARRKQRNRRTAEQHAYGSFVVHGDSP